MAVDLADLRRSVQRNCDIADARHAGDYTMCVYLMKMREYFRWENGYGFGDRLAPEEIGEWLREREALWERLEEAAYEPIRIDGKDHEPFDAASINASLTPHGLVYSAGLGQGCRPHFFLGRLERREREHGFELLIADQEYARDLASPPAMSLDRTVFIRRQSLKRMIWERTEEWRWNRLDNPMGRALSHYDFDGAPEASLDEMADAQIDTLLLHEIGELEAGRLLGEDWERMLAGLSDFHTELLLRTVRDNLADSLSTLPGLLENAAPARLHFFMATLTNLRRAQWPALDRAYQAWHEHGRTSPLDQAAAQGRSHWLEIAEGVLDAYRTEDDAAPRIRALIEAATL